MVGIGWLDLSSVMDGLHAIDEGQSKKVQVRSHPKKKIGKKKWVHPNSQTLPDNIIVKICFFHLGFRTPKKSL